MKYQYNEQRLCVVVNIVVKTVVDVRSSKEKEKRNQEYSFLLYYGLVRHAE